MLDPPLMDRNLVVTFPVGTMIRPLELRVCPLGKRDANVGRLSEEPSDDASNVH